MRRRRGLLIILSSPSGAGKTTLTRRLLAWDPSITFSVSVTTRPQRPGEVEGRDYHFIDHAGFERMIADDALLEHAHVFGHRYGTPRAPVETALAAGRDVIFDIDWQGGQQIRNSALADDVVSIFLLPPSIDELERRLRGRGQDSEEVVRARMQRARDEISHWAEYDYVLVNEDLDETEARLRTIVGAERLRRRRQLWLNDFVRDLYQQYEERFG